jgi:hypothetical protein
MRLSLITGIILTVLGAIVLVRGLSYQTTHDVVKVGDVAVTDSETHNMPRWLGIAGVVGGLVLIGAGVTRRRLAS